MNILKRMINKGAKSRPFVLNDFFSGGSLYSAMGQSSTTFACIDRIANEVASLNYAIYSKSSKQKAKNHSLLRVIKEPNAEDRHFNFFYQSAVDYFSGGCFWLVLRSGGEVVSLFRMDRGGVTIKRNDRTNAIEYEYKGVVYGKEDVIYIPSRFSYSTLRGGQSIFDSADSVFKIAEKLDSFTDSSFTNGTLGKRVVIDIQKALPNITAEEARAIKSRFISEYAGAKNAGKPILKERGFEYSELGTAIDNKTAELIENRRFQEHETAKIFGVPQQLLTCGSGEKEGGAGVEDAFLLFNEFAIRPLATQFQEAINTLLDEDKYYFEFDYQGVLKVAFEKRIDAYIKQINNGLLSPNEARAKENLGAIEAGDNYFMPVNMMPLNDETIKAYMAKQKQTMTDSEDDLGEAFDASTKDGHFLGGDDKV